MENFKDALLVELLEANLSTERKNQLLINLVKNDVTEEDLVEYQALRRLIKSSDDSEKLLPSIDTDALELRIMNAVKSTPTSYDPIHEYKVTTLSHLISARRIKNDRYSS